MPAGANRHRLRIEIRRPLYLREATRERAASFEALRGHLTRVLSEVAKYVRSPMG